ncbi:hypothetical protein [Microscilla marina]|uniref:Uncharacterized protein n=1 Tax=Microscilla marina ATCC 23134 TaxID=313606 RepID=A2A031_MICM2|nr:hypothetical protein [Microscilla marina]EAY24006.1 hypothetical protein M23134_01306 [Microscilla marina ATCC 23134]
MYQQQKIRLEIDHRELDENFQPGEVILQTQQNLDYFPIGGDFNQKKKAVLNEIRSTPVYKESLYFHYKVYLDETIIFQYQGFFEPNPQLRTHIKWAWSESKGMGEGMIFTPKKPKS